MEQDQEGDMTEHEVEQLDKIRFPFANTWVDDDGVRVFGIQCVDDGVIRLLNRWRFGDCCICLKPPNTYGQHRICCLPCGHMYGFSCIKKWLLLSSSNGKCPQCNAKCSFQDATVVYPPPLSLSDYQKASNSAFFPFTEQGFLEFKKYEISRVNDAELLWADDDLHVQILVAKYNDLLARYHEMRRQWDNLITRAEDLEERGESLGRADSLRRQASLLVPRFEPLGRRADALDRLVAALRRRMDALKQRSDAFESRIRFYDKMEKEIAKAKQDLERKKELAEKVAEKLKKKAEKKEKKLKDKEKKDEKEMQGCSTVGLIMVFISIYVLKYLLN